MPQRRASLLMISRTWPGVGFAQGRNFRCTTFLPGALKLSTRTMLAFAVGPLAANARGPTARAVGTAIDNRPVAAIVDMCLRRICMSGPPVDGRADRTGSTWPGDYRHARTGVHAALSCARREASEDVRGGALRFSRVPYVSRGSPDPVCAPSQCK